LKRKASTASLPEREEDKAPAEVEVFDEAAEARKLRRARRSQISDYYSGESFGLPSAMVLFDLCYSLNRAENDQIWLACLGLTDHFLHHKVSTSPIN